MSGPAIFLVGLERETRALGPGAHAVIGVAALEAALAQGASGVISFGLCGALDPDLSVGDVVIGETVASPLRAFWADPAWTDRLAAALPWARRVRVAGSDSIVPGAAAKAALRASTGAAVADMESHLAAAAATLAGAPFAIVRAVSDTAEANLPVAALAGFRPDGRADVVAVLAALARRPWEMGALLRTARDAEAALAALSRHAEAIRGCVGVTPLPAGEGGAHSEAVGG